MFSAVAGFPVNQKTFAQFAPNLKQMINSIELTNFKSIRQQRIDLEKLTVFVGPNAAGKTSVLEAIHLAVRAATPKPGAPLGRPEKVFGYERHCDWLYSRDGAGDMSIACTTPGGTFTVSATPPHGYPPRQVESFGQVRWDFRVWTPEGVNLQDAFHPTRAMVFLHLDAKQLAKSHYSDRTPPRVEYDGEGLAPVLAYMALNDPDGFDALVEEMKSLVPNLRRIRFTKSTIRRVEKRIRSNRRRHCRTPAEAGVSG